MIIKELITKLGFEVDDAALKKLDRGLLAITGGVGGLTTSLAAAGLSLFGLVKTTTDALSKFHDLSEIFGVSVEEISRFSVFANTAGVSTDEFGQSLGFLSRNMEAARKGSEEARKSFKTIGISVQELETLNPGEAIQRIATGLQNVPPGAQRAALAMEFFGRSGARMIPMLNDLAGELTPIQQAILDLNMVTTEQAKQGDALGRSYDFLQVAIKGIIKTIGLSLIPTAQEIVDTISQWIVLNKDLIKQNIKDVVKGLSGALSFTLGVVNSLVQSFSGFVRSLGGLERTVKILLIGLSILSSGALLWGIGSVAQALAMLIVKMGAVGNAALLMQAKALAIPIAIGAAILAVFLLFEDLYVFLNGGDSIIGDLFKAFPKFAKIVSDVFAPIINPIRELFTGIMDGTLSWIDILKLVGQTIFNVITTPLRLILSVVSSITGALGKLAGGGPIGRALSWVSNLADQNTETYSHGASRRLGPSNSSFMPYAPGADSYGPIAPNITPQAAARSAGGGGNTSNQNVNQTLEFNFPPGTDPKSVTPAITSAVDSGLDGFLRTAARAAK